MEVDHDSLLDHNPTTNPLNTPNDSVFPHHPWIRSNAKATLYLPKQMTQPAQGRLLYEDGEWSFLVGRKRHSKSIPLPNFPQNVTSLIYNNKLFNGWKRKSTVITARNLRAISNLMCHQIISRKVSAKELHQLTAPSLKNHYKLHKNDKEIWDK